MERITGLLFDAKRSAKVRCTLSVTADGQAVIEEQMKKPVAFSVVEVSPRLGDSTRFITLPGGFLFETDDNDTVDRLVAVFPPQPKGWHFAVIPWFRIALLCLVLFVSWSFVHFAVPSASHKVAMSVPSEVIVKQGQNAFENFDSDHFDASKLTESRQNAIRNLFQGLIPEGQTEYKYQLHFRDSESLGANAFALPSGDIVMTDDLVQLAHNDEEIAAILLHEIAHVEKRHGVQSVIQTSAMLLGVVLLTGDLTSLNALILAVPAMLLDSGYTRRLEEEADDYSLAEMQRLNIDPINFAEIMTRIERSHSEEGSEENSEVGYWDSHPSTDSRIEKFRQASRRFNQ
jgi:Zn-dependent protease with chaperone function